jgi:hypothetical protein
MNICKQSLVAGLIAIGLVSLSGCMTVQSPALGGIYTNVQYGDTATPAAGANKTGKACATSWFGMVAMGDASIEAAKRAGGITTVSSVDHTANHIVVYGVWCTVVKGQ